MPNSIESVTENKKELVWFEQATLAEARKQTDIAWANLNLTTYLGVLATVFAISQVWNQIILPKHPELILTLEAMPLFIILVGGVIPVLLLNTFIWPVNPWKKTK